MASPYHRALSSFFVVPMAGGPGGASTLLATCRHVLPEGPDADAPRRIAVLAQSAARGREAGDMRLAEVVASDRQHDLALLRSNWPSGWASTSCRATPACRSLSTAAPTSAA